MPKNMIIQTSMSLQDVTIPLSIVCSPASRKPIVLTPFLEVTVLQNWSGMTFSILTLLEANPTLYLDRIQLQLKTVLHVDVSLPTICSQPLPPRMAQDGQEERKARVFRRHVDARKGNGLIPPDPGSLSHSHFQNSQLICKGPYSNTGTVHVCLFSIR
jgi:hypothetical protein